MVGNIRDLSINKFLEFLNVRFRFDGRKASHFHHMKRVDIERSYDSDVVFVVSTGRSGSAFIEHFFSGDARIAAYHEPFPCLAEFPQYVCNEEQEGFSRGLFLGARSQLIQEAFNKNKIYLESNQVVSFLIKEISGLYKNAKFVHLVRSPESFVKSSLKKGWYLNDTVWEFGRIKGSEGWEEYSVEEKLAWYWSEVNFRIESDLEVIAPTNKLKIRLEDLVGGGSQADGLLDFVGGAKFRKSGRNKKINETKGAAWWFGDNLRLDPERKIGAVSIDNSHDKFTMLKKLYGY